MIELSLLLLPLLESDADDDDDEEEAEKAEPLCPVDGFLFRRYERGSALAGSVLTGPDGRE